MSAETADETGSKSPLRQFNVLVGGMVAYATRTDIFGMSSATIETAGASIEKMKNQAVGKALVASNRAETFIEGAVRWHRHDSGAPDPYFTKLAKNETLTSIANLDAVGKIEKKARAAKSGFAVGAAIAGPLLIVGGVKQAIRAGDDADPIKAEYDRVAGIGKISQGLATTTSGFVTAGMFNKAASVVKNVKFLGVVGTVAGTLANGMEAKSAMREADMLEIQGHSAAASEKKSEGYWKVAGAVGNLAMGGAIILCAGTAGIPLLVFVTVSVAVSLGTDAMAEHHKDNAKALLETPPDKITGKSMVNKLTARRAPQSGEEVLSHSIMAP